MFIILQMNVYNYRIVLKLETIWYSRMFLKQKWFQVDKVEFLFGTLDSPRKTWNRPDIFLLYNFDLEFAEKMC